MKSDGMANGASSAGAAEQAPSSGSPLLEAVSFHALESRNDGALWDCSPGCVIMYDSDVAFVRQLEVKPDPQFMTPNTCLPGAPCLQASMTVLDGGSVQCFRKSEGFCMGWPLTSTILGAGLCSEQERRAPEDLQPALREQL